MKSSWGNVKIVTSKYDVCVYGQARKKYTRKHPYPLNTMHIKPLPREKCAIIKLTNLGYSINQLSDAFGRSTSFVHKCVRNSINVGIAHFVNKRKLPSQIRLACSASRRRMLQKWFSLWEAFILGEVDKPP